MCTSGYSLIVPCVHAVVTAAMLPLLVRPLAESDADFDADRVGSTVSSVAIAGGARLPSDALQGRVGPGCVLDTPSHDGRSPDCPPSYFNAGTRQHRVFTNSKYFACPVYSHARRGADDHVFDVWLPASRPAQHWTLRGVHLLL